MASTAPTHSAAPMLEERFAELLRDVREFVERQTASASAEAGQRAAREAADSLNQAVRRMRQAGGVRELAAVLTGAALPFASGVAFFRVERGAARGECIRGVPEESAAPFPALAVPLASAPALAASVESRDPVTTAAIPGEISSELAALPGLAAEGRVSIFPVVHRESVPALLLAWGAVQGPPLELFTQVAGALWNVLTARGAAGLLSIGAAQPASAWDRLSPGEQETHLRAQRFARVRAAEMRLHDGAAVQTGRARRDLYAALRRPIDAARQEFREKFFTACPSMVDYLHLELLRTLANDDPELLGKDYPGPMA